MAGCQRGERAPQWGKCISGKGRRAGKGTKPREKGNERSKTATGSDRSGQRIFMKNGSPPGGVTWHKCGGVAWGALGREPETSPERGECGNNAQGNNSMKR